MLNRKHKISHQKNNVDILSFTEAITVELLSPVAEPPHWAHLSGPFFFFKPHPGIWPNRNEKDSFNLYSCFSNMYHHHAFNFDTIP